MSQRQPNPNEVESDATDPGGRWGWTLGLGAQGDLRRNALNEYALIYDEDAVVQSLKVALLTPEGFDPLRPRYGLDYSRAFGENDPQLRLAIHDAIGPNAAGIKRVENIERININREAGDRDNVSLYIVVSLRSGGVRSFPFALQTSNYPTGEIPDWEDR